MIRPYYWLQSYGRLRGRIRTVSFDLPRSNNTDRIMGAVLRTVRCLHLRRIRSRFHSIWLPVLRCSKPVSVYGRIWPVTNSITVRNTAPINTVRNGVPFWSTWGVFDRTSQYYDTEIYDRNTEPGNTIKYGEILSFTTVFIWPGDQ